MKKPMNPLEEFLEHKTATIAEKRQYELTDWHAWNQGGRTPDLLDPLLDRFQPLVNQRVRQWHSDFIIPKPAFKAELQKQLINAIHSYNPDKGANLNTHVNIRLQKAQRFRGQYQNLAQIPEQLIAKIGPMERAKEDLKSEYGRPPSATELAGHLGMNVKQLQQLQTMAGRKDTFNSQYLADPDVQNLSRDAEVLGLLHHNLNDKQKSVFDYFYGRDGKPKIQSTGEIAKRLDMTEPQVSRLKSQIADQFKKYR